MYLITKTMAANADIPSKEILSENPGVADIVARAFDVVSTVLERMRSGDKQMRLCGPRKASDCARACDCAQRRDAQVLLSHETLLGS